MQNGEEGVAAAAVAVQCVADEDEGKGKGEEEKKEERVREKSEDGGEALYGNSRHRSANANSPGDKQKRKGSKDVKMERRESVFFFSLFSLDSPPRKQRRRITAAPAAAAVEDKVDGDAGVTADELRPPSTLASFPLSVHSRCECLRLLPDKPPFRPPLYQLTRRGNPCDLSPPVACGVA